MNKRYVAPSILWFLLIFGLAGCGVGNQQKGRQPSADWSRGLPVGSDLRGAVNLRVEPDGERVHFAWPTGVEDEGALHYQQLDTGASVVLEKVLDLPAGRVHSPEMLLQEDGTITLFWVARPAGEDGWQVRVATLDENGDVIVPAEILTPVEMNVSGYAVAQASGEQQTLVWEDRRSGTLYGMRLADGVPSGEMIELATGADPALAVSADGALHMVWLDESELYFARFPAGSLSPVSATRVALLDIIFGDALTRPALAVSGDWVYILWSIFSQSGLESGTGRTEYIAFLAAEPRHVEPEPVRIMPLEEPPYTPYDDSNFSLTQLVSPPASPSMNTDYVGDPAITAGRGSEAAAVVSANQAWRQQTVAQLALLLFDGGELRGYQMAGKTQTVSQDGTIATDEMGNLYLAWGEGAGGLNAYFATTAPEMQQEINRLDPGDAANVALTSGMESVVGLMFMPLAVLWMLPGLLVTGLYRLLRQEEDSGTVGSRLIFVVASVLYQIVKIMFMPAIQTYVPFSAWLDIPTSLQEPLLLLVPLVIFLVGVFVAEIYRRRREETSTLVYFFVAAAVDGALTLFVYGVNFLGVF